MLWRCVPPPSYGGLALTPDGRKALLATSQGISTYCTETGETTSGPALPDVHGSPEKLWMSVTSRDEIFAVCASNCSTGFYFGGRKGDTWEPEWKEHGLPPSAIMGARPLAAADGGCWLLLLESPDVILIPVQGGKLLLDGRVQLQHQIPVDKVGTYRGCSGLTGERVAIDNNQDGKVFVFCAKTGQLVYEVHELINRLRPELSTKKLYYPQDVCDDGAGGVIVADGANQRLVRADREGKTVEVARVGGGMDWPWAISNRAGVLVTCQQKSGLVVFSMDPDGVQAEDDDQGDGVQGPWAFKHAD
eukprot:Hpha_TRINITY_DN6022_c0_g1::TRINITY_DN6022_c0_g1_i2::g.63432::m.63432